MVVALIEKPQDVKDEKGTITGKDYSKKKAMAIAGLSLLVAGWLLVRMLGWVMCQRYGLMCGGD